MLAEQIRQAVATAHRKALDEIARVMWEGHAKGLISEDEAQELSEAIEARRAADRLSQSQSRSGSSIFPRRRPQKRADPSEAMERRRQCALSGALPPQVGSKFTHHEVAAISIIVGQIRSTKTGDCRLCYEAIAAMAGVSRSTVKRAVSTGVQIGLLRVTLRPVKGRRNLPNIIEVIDHAVIAWIKRGPRRPISPDRGPQQGRHEYKDSKKRLPAGVAARPRVKIDPVNSWKKQYYVE